MRPADDDTPGIDSRQSELATRSHHPRPRQIVKFAAGDASASASAHIHLGAPSTAGTPFLYLAHAPSPFSGTLTESGFAINGGPGSWEAGLEDLLVLVHRQVDQLQAGEQVDALRGR